MSTKQKKFTHNMPTRDKNQSRRMLAWKFHRIIDIALIIKLSILVDVLCLLFFNMMVMVMNFFLRKWIKQINILEMLYSLYKFHIRLSGNIILILFKNCDFNFFFIWRKSLKNLIEMLFVITDVPSFNIKIFLIKGSTSKNLAMVSFLTNIKIIIKFFNFNLSFLSFYQIF